MYTIYMHIYFLHCSFRNFVSTLSCHPITASRIKVTSCGISKKMFMDVVFVGMQKTIWLKWTHVWWPRSDVSSQSDESSQSLINCTESRGALLFFFFKYKPAWINDRAVFHFVKIWLLKKNRTIFRQLELPLGIITSNNLCHLHFHIWEQSMLVIPFFQLFCSVGLLRCYYSIDIIIPIMQIGNIPFSHRTNIIDFIFDLMIFFFFIIVSFIKLLSGFSMALVLLLEFTLTHMTQQIL